MREPLGKLPARGFAHELLLPQTKHNLRTHRQDWLLHREDVLLHALHVELVFSLVDGKEFAPRRYIRNFGDAFYDDRFLRMFRAHDAIFVLCQVASFARFASRAEQETPVLPQAPNHHCVRRNALRRTNGFDGGDPVVVRFLQSLLSPTPRKQTLVAGGQTIARGVRTAGFGLYCSRRGLLRWHELYLSPAGDSEILLRPLVDALQRLLQILQRIGHAEAQ